MKLEARKLIVDFMEVMNRNNVTYHKGFHAEQNENWFRTAYGLLKVDGFSPDFVIKEIEKVYDKKQFKNLPKFRRHLQRKVKNDIKGIYKRERDRCNSESAESVNESSFKLAKSKMFTR